MVDLVTSQKLLDTETRTVYKFTNVSDGTGEASVKKIDLSELNWAIHTITLSANSTENFKIGEVITTDATEHYLVTNFAAGAGTVDVVGWDNTNKVATSILTSASATDAIVGGVSGNHTETYASIAEKDYDVVINKIQWICNGMTVNVEWDGSVTETLIAGLSGNGVYNGNNLEFPAISINAAGDTGNVLGDIQFTTAGASSGDTYTIWIELSKKPSGYNLPHYEHNSQLGHPVDFVVGNR
jgi:hypothetical protein